MATFNVLAHWDADARVWWAESDDVPGLAVEAETHDGLIEEIRHVVPELLAMNLPNIDRAKTTLHIVSDQIEEVSYA